MLQQYLASAKEWAIANPTLAWPILSAVLILLFKPRTPAQYARLAARNPTWFFARLAAFWQLLGALGLDPVKALAVIIKVIGGTQKGDDDKKDPPAGGATPLLVGAAFACMLTLSVSACSPMARAAFAELLANKIACAVAHQNLEPSQMAIACALDPDDLPLVLQAVGEAREAGARQAVQAAARQRDLDEKVGVCRAEKP